ncbi:MAG: tRNA lysidine(34) synthetase TilS, partial [Candidatus Syntrophosphaera sp.]
IPLIVRRIEVGKGPGLENRARSKRLGVFREILELYRFDFIVTGHHNDDQTETMLMNLVRGAGLAGLAGIKPQSGDILHPLLCFSKAELVEMLESEGIPWREDASNRDQGFRRNWIRHTLIPLLEKELNPAAGWKIGQQARIFEEAENIVLQKVQPLIRKCVTEQAPGEVRLSLPRLLRQSRIEQYYVLRDVIGSVSGTQRDFFQHNFDEVMALGGSSGSKYVRLHNGVYARKEYKELIISANPPTQAPPEPYVVEEERSRAVYGEYRFSFKILKVLPARRDESGFNIYLDADKVNFPFTIRSRRPGDRFMPFGMDRLKKLKDFFIDAKVPKFERDHVPIFDDGSKIFWIAGHRLDSRVAMDKDTQRYLHITAEPLHAKPMRAAIRSKKSGEENEPYEL